MKPMPILTSETPQIQTRLDPEADQRIRMAAVREKSSLGAVISRLAITYLDPTGLDFNTPAPVVHKNDNFERTV